MNTLDGMEFGTKDEVTAACKEFCHKHPGTVFHNHASHKDVRTSDNRITLYSWNKLYYDSLLVKANPELKGTLWVKCQVVL